MPLNPSLALQRPHINIKSVGQENTVVLVPECVKYFPISSPSELHHRQIQRAGEGSEGLTRRSVQRVGGAELHGRGLLPKQPGPEKGPGSGCDLPPALGTALDCGVGVMWVDTMFGRLQGTAHRWPRSRVVIIS